MAVLPARTDSSNDDTGMAEIVRHVQTLLREGKITEEQVQQWLTGVTRNRVPSKPAPTAQRDHLALKDVTNNGVLESGRTGDTKVATSGDYYDQPQVGRADVVIINGANGTGTTATKETTGMSAAEQRYLVWARERALRLPLSALGIEAAMGDRGATDIRMSDLFVPLNSTRHQQARQVEDQTRVQAPVLEQINAIRLLVVLGDPGSGKTTLLNFLTYILATDRLRPDLKYIERLNVPGSKHQKASNWRHGALLPVRIDLSEFAAFIKGRRVRATTRLVEQYIGHMLEQHGHPEFTKELLALAKKGNVLFMFDGLDEISSQEKRQIVRDALHDFTTAYLKNQFIATCRVLSYSNPDWQLKLYTPVKLAALDEPSIKLFIQNWYTTLERRGYMPKEKAMLRIRQMSDDVQYVPELAGNPMLLTVMAVLHTRLGVLPLERAQLYSDCVDLLLWDWQRAKKISEDEWEDSIIEELGTNETVLLNALCEVAFNAHSAQNGSAGATGINEADILKVLQNALDNDWGKAQRFCSYVEKRAGLLISRGREGSNEVIFSFPHRGFQEFLAARHLVVGRQDFARLAMSLSKGSDVWREVLLLAIGHITHNNGEVYRALDAINLLANSVIPEKEEDWRTIWWAAEMLSVVGVSNAEKDEPAGKPLLKRLVQQLVTLVSEGHLSPIARAQAADALGQLGDPRPGVCTVEPKLVDVPGGVYRIGANDDAHAVTLKPFQAAIYPVTNRQFERFFTVGYHNDRYWTIPAGLEWRKLSTEHGGYTWATGWGAPNRPVVGVSWYEAMAYVNWLRARTRKEYRLLSEAEWEVIAGGKEQRRYASGASRAKNGDMNLRESGIGQTTAVGIFPQDKTPEGIYDLWGNVWEWTSSLERPYPFDASQEKPGLLKDGKRILRGGSYDNSRPDVYAHTRRALNPDSGFYLTGFRLACGPY